MDASQQASHSRHTEAGLVAIGIGLRALQTMAGRAVRKGVVVRASLRVRRYGPDTLPLLVDQLDHACILTLASPDSAIRDRFLARLSPFRFRSRWGSDIRSSSDADAKCRTVQRNRTLPLSRGLWLHT
jgi:hypothetical protein